MSSSDHLPRRAGDTAARLMAGRDAVDPFAAPAGYAPARTPARPRVQSAFRSAPAGGEFALCPCLDGHDGECGTPTTMLASKVSSRAAARLLRCATCLTDGHRPGKPAPASADEKSAVAIVTARTEALDADALEDARIDAEIRAEADKRKWGKALTDFQAAIPAVFAKDLKRNDLAPQVNDRIARLKAGRGEHQLSLLCYGPYGSGKTWVAYSYPRTAVADALLWPSQIIAGTEAEIMEPLWTGSFQTMQEHEARLFSPRVRMILVDDVGNMGRYSQSASKDPAAERHRLWTRLVNHCYANQMALIITTNLNPGERESLQQYIGVTAYERLRNMVGRDPVFRDKNRRPQQAAQWEAEYQNAQHPAGDQS